MYCICIVLIKTRPKPEVNREHCTRLFTLYIPRRWRFHLCLFLLRYAVVAEWLLSYLPRCAYPGRQWCCGKV